MSDIDWEKRAFLIELRNLLRNYDACICTQPADGLSIILLDKPVLDGFYEYLDAGLLTKILESKTAISTER